MSRVEKELNAFKRTVLHKFSGAIRLSDEWQRRWSNELYELPFFLNENLFSRSESPPCEPLLEYIQPLHYYYVIAT